MHFLLTASLASLCSATPCFTSKSAPTCLALYRYERVTLESGICLCSFSLSLSLSLSLCVCVCVCFIYFIFERKTDRTPLIFVFIFSPPPDDTILWVHAPGMLHLLPDAGHNRLLFVADVQSLHLQESQARLTPESKNKTHTHTHTLFCLYHFLTFVHLLSFICLCFRPCLHSNIIGLACISTSESLFLHFSSFSSSSCSVRILQTRFV